MAKLIKPILFNHIALAWNFDHNISLKPLVQLVMYVFFIELKKQFT